MDKSFAKRGADDSAGGFIMAAFKDRLWACHFGEMVCGLAIAVAVFQPVPLFSEGLDWVTGENKLPLDWRSSGTGQVQVIPQFEDEKHAVAEMVSEGDSLVLYNYNLASAYKHEGTVVRYRVQWLEPCVGILNFANDGGGGRGGAGVYFTKEGILVVADEKGVRTELGNYLAGVWYEVVAVLSPKSNTWDVQVTDGSTGKVDSLKGLPWTTPSVFSENACAGPAVSIWSKGTVYISEIEMSPYNDDVIKTKTALLAPNLGIQVATAEHAASHANPFIFSTVTKWRLFQ